MSFFEIKVHSTQITVCVGLCLTNQFPYAFVMSMNTFLYNDIAFGYVPDIDFCL